MNNKRESIAAIEHVQNRLDVMKKAHPKIDTQILRSALIYQKLHLTHFNKIIYIQNILDEYDGEIGKIGPGDGCLTNVICEKLFGSINICHMHSAFHDAYGRFYTKYNAGRGYLYAIPEKYTPKWIKKCALLGHITGLLWCIKNKNQLEQLFE